LFLAVISSVKMSHGNRLAKAATGVVVYGGYSGKAAAAGGGIY
jgi:hypothetical protein